MGFLRKNLNNIDAVIMLKLLLFGNSKVRILIRSKTNVWNGVRAVKQTQNDDNDDDDDVNNNKSFEDAIDWETLWKCSAHLNRYRIWHISGK